MLGVYNEGDEYSLNVFKEMDSRIRFHLVR